jgi:hypothetical protein
MTEDKDAGGGSGDPADLPMYLGPYETWNFGVGRNYALPIMQKHWRFISALAEIGVVQGKNELQQIERNGWLPTLWGEPECLRFIPFIVRNPIDTMPKLKDLESLLYNAFRNVMQQYWYTAAPAGSSTPPSGSVSILLDRVKNSRFRVAFPVADKAMHELESRPKDPIWHPDPDLRDRIGKDARITVMAVIDDGLPFAHRNFRDASGTRSRIEFCWLQSVAIDEGQESVLFGREYTREQIEDLIKQHGNDEDALYRDAGATADTEDLGSMINRHATHGAHVMDLATGYAPERGETPPEEIRIIAVQLPNTIAWDTSGFGKDMYMLTAFHYILHRADIIAAKEGYHVDNMRLVINFSYGFSGGRHDGGTELEAAINQLIQKRRSEKTSPTALVLPAGNTFLDRLHGLISPDDFIDNAAQFHWRVQPNDRTPSYLELWFWQDFRPRGYRIELWDPWGRLRSSFDIEIKDTTRSNGDPNTMDDILNDLQQQIGQISVDRHRYEGRMAQNTVDRDAPKPDEIGRYRVLIVLAPTEPEDACLPRTDSGKWTVVVRRGQTAALLQDPIHYWIQRSADPESLRSGSRQSYFDHYKNERYDLNGDLREDDSSSAFVKRFGSLNGLATGSTSLVVAGYRLGAGLGSSLACARPARYSSAGVMGENWPNKQVDCASMSDRSRALPGTIAAGVRSGSRSLVQGTSTAAPFVARQLAETFVTAEESDVQQAKDNNYLSLLCGYELEAGKTAGAAGGNDFGCHKDDPKFIKARLGTMLVPPHRQPGIESRAYDQKGASKNNAGD